MHGCCHTAFFSPHLTFKNKGAMSRVRLSSPRGDVRGWANTSVRSGGKQQREEEQKGEVDRMIKGDV